MVYTWSSIEHAAGCQKLVCSWIIWSTKPGDKRGRAPYKNYNKA